MTRPIEDEPPVRRYNDAEVRQLLERAASMKGRTPATVRPQGFTLAQLEEIAAEAQIDVARLREAARELDMGAMRPAGVMARLAGAPLHVRAEHTLPFEPDADELGALVNTISRTIGVSGKSSIVGRTFTWDAHTASGRRTEVRVSVHRGRTHIWIEERYTEIAGGVFGGVMGGAGGGIGFGVGIQVANALGSAAVAVAFPIAVFGGLYAACRMGFGAYVRSRARRVGELCERIVQDLTALHDADDA